MTKLLSSKQNLKYQLCLGLSLILLSQLVVLTCSQNVAKADDPQPEWPTQALSMRYDNSHNAVWGTALDSDINWTFDTKDPMDTPFTDVIVVDGIAYFGTMMNNVYALDAVTGKQLWKFMANNWIMTDPVVADGKLFAGSGNRLFQNEHLRGTGANSLYALDAKTGQKIWEYSVPGEAMPTPVYNKGMVYFVTGDSTFYALDANSGQLKYKIPTPSFFSMSSLSMDGNRLYAGGAKPYGVYAFDTTTQTIAWQQMFPNIQWAMDDASPAIDNGLVFSEGVTENYSAENSQPNEYLYALDESTGQVKWTFNMGVGVFIPDNKSGTTVVKDGVVYVGSPITRRFYALAEATGKLLWSYNAGAPIRGAAVVIDKYVVFSDLAGNVHVLNRSDGSFVDRLKLGGSISPGGPGLLNGTIYVANQNGKVYAFSLFKLISQQLLKAQPRPASPDSASQQYFSSTGHTVSGNFLTYWQQHGGLTQFGYPLSDPFPEFQVATGKTYTVQYFERARFESHPELAGSTNEVELGPLGTILTSNRSQQTPFVRLANPPASANGSIFFATTGHTLSSDFLTYWQAQGGQARYGNPLSEPFNEVSKTDGKSYLVQYFERARFEFHPEFSDTRYRVELGLLGTEITRQ